MNINKFCSQPGQEGKLCWIVALSEPESDITGFQNAANIQNDLTICRDCEQFKETTQRGFGRRTADQAIINTVMRLLELLSIEKQNLQRTADMLKYSLEQLTLLKNITDALARSDSLEKSLKIILTGATSGDAFGFNRAAVFLVNEYTDMLEGRAAIGPESPEEADRIWGKISQIPLSRLLEEILVEDGFIPCTLETRIAGIKIPLNDSDNLFIKILSEARETILTIENIKLEDLDFSWCSPGEKIVAVPLISEGKPLGLLIADNDITKKPITGDLVDALKALANACAPGLQNAILNEKLQAQIKELERMHEMLRQNQAYLIKRERLADIGLLATKIAHELRIPLVTIGGYARRIEKTIGSDKFDKNMVKVIIEEIDRLIKISSDMLEYSRSPRLNIKECNINDIIEESLSQLDERLSQSGININRISSGSSLSVMIDPERLKQVILNLVDNAIDAMEKGGKLTIETTRNNEYITIDIEDTGKGMDKRELDNLFNLFYTTKAKGSGLGLPVSKKIIDDHGGYIEVNSVPNRGSIFSVRIPASYNFQEAGKVNEN